MKKYLLLFIIALNVGFAQAQEHMSFKGVAMGCELKSFVAQLETMGYETFYTEDRATVLKGDFAGQRDCTIYVFGTPISKVVWKVVVQFSEKDTWYSLKSCYMSFKESYTGKYGQPESYEFFRSPYYEGDGYELQALKSDKCLYNSFYTTSEGAICLGINDNCCVQVIYEDRVNSDVWEQENNNVVSNDI